MPNFSFSRNSLENLSEVKKYSILSIMVCEIGFVAISWVNKTKILLPSMAYLFSIKSRALNTSKLFFFARINASPIKSTHGVAVETL